MFDEGIFLRSLTERPESARQMSRTFEIDWLETAEYRPILQSVFDFIKEKSIPPSISTLRDIFKGKDKTRYENRFKEVFDQLEKLTPSQSDIIFHLDKAKEVAITRSLTNLVRSEHFQRLQEEHSGAEMIDEINKWKRLFEGQSRSVELDFKQAIDNLISERGWNLHEQQPIPVGIPFIDDWSGGGLRRKQLSILLAPSGHGKSQLLTIIAHNIAKQLDNKVLYISNELSMEEITERFLAKVTGTSLSKITVDPVAGYKGLARHWQAGLHNHLRLVEVLEEFDTDYIESLISKYINLYGWKPDVIVLDFMERMKPTVTGVRRDQSWNWLGYIAKDLVRLAKRGNYLIWTAGQINRGGYDAPEQSMSQAQGSIQHLQEAALVVAMRKISSTNIKMESEEADILQFKPLKVRNAKASWDPIYVEARLGHLSITNKMRTAEECLKSLMKKQKNDSDVP